MIASGKNDIDVILAKMPNYRRKKRDVRRVVEIDPDRWLQCRCGPAALFSEKPRFPNEKI